MFAERKRFLSLCVQGMRDLGHHEDEAYKDRLRSEIKEIDAQAEHEYFLHLVDSNSYYPENENNLITPYLLRICDSFDINKPSRFIQGEFPDIDIDYIKSVRDYLKLEWAPKRFGREKVCAIGTYGTSGIKSAMLDMTRVYGLPLAEIQAITKEIDDKDDDGKPLEWEKALEIYSDFAAYCEKHPDIASAAKLLINRNRTAGVHAGGLIISDRPLSGFVPLEVRSITDENPHGIICSAWPEGLHSQDLQPVGLIKFDLLVIANLMQIALACDLIKKRHGLKSICALEGDYDWSDTSYLNDPDSLAMANKGDLKCIFQFDSDGMRRLIKKGGVTSFDDLVAYSSLYRPGCLRCLPSTSKVKISDGEKPIAELKNWEDKIAYVNDKGKFSYTHKYAIWKTKNKKLVRIRTKSGKILECSLDHPILSGDFKYKKASQLKLNDKIAVTKS